MTIENTTIPVRFDTKIAVVLRNDLPVWQKLNVTAFLISGITAQHPDIMGEDYVDADGVRFNALCGQPIICMAADAETLQNIHRRAIEKEVRTSVYIEEMFATGHDRANREVFAKSGNNTTNVVGVALRSNKKRVDKITDGAKLHRQVIVMFLQHHEKAGDNVFAVKGRVVYTADCRAGVPASWLY